MAEDLGLNVSLALESQSYQQQITAINRQMTVVQASFNSASTALGGFGTETQALEAKAQKLTQQIQLSQGKVDLLTAAHERAKSVLATNVTANETLRQQVEQTTNAYNNSVTATGANSTESIALRGDLDALNTTFTQSNATILRNNATVDNLNIRLQNTQAAQNKLQNELVQTNTDIETQTNSMSDLGASTEENNEKFKAFGEKMASMGKVAAAGIAAIGLAFIGVITGGVKMSDELTKALNGLQSSTGVTDDKMVGMKDTMLAIYNNNFGENFEEIGVAMAAVGKETGATGTELQGLTEKAFLMRDTFGMEVADSVKAVTQLTKQFGISGTEAYNLIAQGAQNGMNKNEDLLDIIQEYSVQFKGMGFTADEMFNMLSNGAKAGGFSIDVMGDAVKEFNIRSKDASKSTEGAFTSLGLNAAELTKAFGKGGEDGKKAFTTVSDALGKCKDPLVQNQVGTALWGTMWEDLGAKSILALGNTTGEIDKTKDALTKINDVKYNSFGEGIEGIKRQLLTGIVLPLGEEVLPKLNEFGNYLKQNMPAIIEGVKPVIMGFLGTFETLASNFQKFIPVIAAVLSGFVAYKAISGVNALMVAFTTFTTLASGAQVSLNVAMLANPIGLIVVAIAALVAGIVLVYQNFDKLKGMFDSLNGPVKSVVGAFLLFNPATAIIIGAAVAIKGIEYAMSDAIPKADLFGEGISKGTKKAVQGYLDLDTNATKSLMSLNFSGQKVSKETATSLTKTFADMGTQIKSGMDKHYGESLKTMTDTFAKSSALTDKEEKDILAKMKTNNDKKKESVDAGEKQIKLILDTASKEKRSLTTEEQTKINGIQATMKTNAVKSLSDTEVAIGGTFYGLNIIDIINCDDLNIIINYIIIYCKFKG